MKRARLAIFMGYIGEEYNGMQWQKETHVRTIENEIVRKLHAEGLLRTDSFIELVKLYKFSRAARTDKGVHALINGVSCVFSLKDDFWVRTNQPEESIEPTDRTEQAQKPQKVQEEHCADEQGKKETGRRQPRYRLDTKKLLAAIRSLFTSSALTIYSIKEVAGHFDIRQAVKTRTYCYVCPVFLFEPNNQEQKLSIEQTLEKINRLCKYYIGTRNYHNYSNGIKAKDPSAKRYMLSMKCESFPIDGILQEKWEDAPSWFRFTLHGQSFIYHQIRKMVGMIMQVCLFSEPESLIENTFFNNQLKILLAPAEGLYLETLLFDSYNKLENIPEPLTFEEERPLIEEMRLRIHRKVLESERTDKKFSEWLTQTRKGESPKEQPMSQMIEQ